MSETKHDSAQQQMWLELFLDLVFVAALSMVNSYVLDRPSRTFLSDSVIATAALFTIWLVVSTLNTWFPRDTTMRRMQTLVIMAGLMLGALSIDPLNGMSQQVGQIGFAAVLFAASLMVPHGPEVTSTERIPLRWLTATMWLAVATSIFGALVDFRPQTEFLLMLVTTALVAIPLAVVYRHRARARLHCDAEHMTERIGLLMLIVLGEGFTVLAVFFDRPNAQMDARFFLATFVLAFLLWRLFFDGVLARGGAFHRWPAATFGAFLLLLGITWIFDVFAELTAPMPNATPLGDSVQVALSTTVSLVGFALLTYARAARMDAQSWIHVIVAAVNLSIVGAVVLVGSDVRAAALWAGLFIAVDSVLAVRWANRIDTQRQPSS